jgi:hypothetical protein
MKKQISFIAILILMTSLSSCNQSATAVEKTANSKAPATEDLPATEGVENENQLVLDEGKPWLANLETTQGVNAIISLVNSFEKSEEIEYYQALQDTLQIEFQLIFKRCTMQGEAHNQLHHFLIPIKDSFEGLKSEDLDQAQRAYYELKEHLKLYHQFFTS